MTDQEDWTITFRLRGFLGGSGTAMPDVPVDGQKLWRLLRDAANEIDQLNAELASQAKYARGTDWTRQAIEVARRIARGEVVVELTREDLAQAVVELACRPNKIDRRRIEDDADWSRASGDAECITLGCGRPYHEHPAVPGYEWLRRLCNGKLVKL